MKPVSRSQTARSKHRLRFTDDARLFYLVSGKFPTALIRGEMHRAKSLLRRIDSNADPLMLDTTPDVVA